MSASLSAERDRIQRQVEELEQSLSATGTELELLSSETDDGSDDNDDMEEKEEGQSAAGLLAQREKIQREIQQLENVLGPQSPVCVSDEDSSSSDESELGLSLSVDSCLQMNLVYQQVLQETLGQLETLLTQNHRQQEEVMSQLSGPIKEPSREPRPPPSSCQQPINMFLGRFLKPYFKDKLTGLGPPANQETKEKASRMTGCLDHNILKLRRWESWQKTLLIHSVTTDSLRKLIQPKLSRMDYLSQKLSSAGETDRQQLRQQIDSLEREIHLLKEKKEEELTGDRYEDHDWQKISNVDFEGTRDAEDIRLFWQNFLHPSINKSVWSPEEVEQLRDVSRRHQERDWESIAAELGTGRTAFLCLQTFQRFVSDSLKHGSWTPAEDALLRELVDKMRIGNFIPYTQMSYFMEGRDPAQIIYRWNQVLDPSLKKGPWTPQEDQLLLQAVARYGEKDWWRIRLDVPGRTDSGCRDRYYDCLKADTKRGPFDKQEKKLLVQLVEKHGVGRWAKIAAEIPHRVDAQCLRAWRTLSKQLLGSPAEKKPKKPKKPPVRREAPKKKKKEDAPAKKRIRRRLVKIKKEVDEENVTSEEEMVVEYMDSDEEEKKKTEEMVETLRTEEVEKEEEEEEETYFFPLIRDWIPAENSENFTFLNFRPVELSSSSSGHVHSGKPVRSTILGQFGHSVIIGPNPRELPWEERHSRSAMMMVSPEELRAYLSCQADTFNKPHSAPPGTVPPSKQKRVPRMKQQELDFELQAAVTPWIGNLIIPAKTTLMAADILRERAEKTRLSSTAVFLLLLQSMNVDSIGCKEMIEKRRSQVALWKPPQEPVRRPDQKTRKNLRTVAEILEQQNTRAGQQEVDQQHRLILEQLKLLQQHKQQQLLPRQQPQQVILLQQPAPPRPRHPAPAHSHPAATPPSRCLSVPSPNRPRFLLHMSPQTSPMSFPPAVILPQPVPHTHAASIRRLTPAPLRSPPAVVLAPPTPHRPTVPPVSVVPGSFNGTSTSSTSSHQQTGPRNLMVAPPSSPNQSLSIGSTLSNQHAVSSTSSSSSSQSCPAPGSSSSVLGPLRGKGHQGVCSSQNSVDVGGTGDDVDGAYTGVDISGDGVMKEGRRIRKLSLKAKALHEATEAKAEVQKKSAPSPRKKPQIQNTNCLPQTVVPPPQQECQAPQLTTPPAAPQLTTPPAAPQLTTPPTAPQLTTPPAAPQLTTPPAAPQLTTPPAAPQLTTTPTAPQLTTPPAAPQLTTTPTAPQLTTTPAAPQLTTTPAAPQLTTPPAAPQLTTTPTAPQLTTPPTAPQLTTTPAAPQLTTTPTAPQLTTTPAAPQLTTTLTVPQLTTPPAAPQLTTTPAAPQLTTPPTAPQLTTPPAAPRLATPPAARQLTTPPTAPQLTTPPAAPSRPPPAAVVSAEAPSPPSDQQTMPPPVSVNSSPIDTTVSSTQNIILTPPPSLSTNQNTASSTFSQPFFHNDHDYTTSYSDSSQISPAHKETKRRRRKPAAAPKKPPRAPPRGGKRRREEEEPRVTSSQDEAECVGRTGEVVDGAGDEGGGAGTGVTKEGKRIRKPSMRARALQEAAQEKTEAKKKRTSSPRQKRCRTSRSKKEVAVQNQPASQLSGLCLRPGQSMWVMTTAGLVQLACVPSSPFPAPPGNILNRQQATPPLRLPGSPRSIAPQPSAVSAPTNLPRLSPPQPLPPAFVLQPVPNPASSPTPPSNGLLPYKGTVRVDSVASPPLRREVLQFDPSLMFVESQAAVCDWLSGLGGVVVPGVGVALPYLPPFVSSLSTLSALLRAKKSLTSSSLQLLSRESNPPETEPDPKSSTETTTNQLQDLPDSTSDLRPAPSGSSNLLQEEMEEMKEAEEAELIMSVRQLVAERFSDNPAYQMLKARFLSCFTVPAFLATVEPITEQTVNCPANKEKEREVEEENEKDEDLKKIKERGKQRKVVRSLLLCGGSGAPANHFSGIISTNTPTTDQTAPEQTGL